MNSTKVIAFATFVKRISDFHHHKIWGAQVLRRVIFYLIVMFGIMINSASAAPCFNNAQSAYNYLLAQETAQTQARDHNRVNINRASEGEWVSLHGIGSSKAQAIVS